MKVQEILKRYEVDYEVLPHSPTYDAQRLAEAVHAPGQMVAKTVLLRADHSFSHVVAVLPATHTVDFEAAGALLGGAKLELATELEIKEHCPDCEMGALPPFGTQYGMQTLLDRSLLSDEEIIFEGDNHSEAIRVRLEDFRRVENPLVGDFAISPTPR